MDDRYRGTYNACAREMGQSMLKSDLQEILPVNFLVLGEAAKRGVLDHKILRPKEKRFLMGQDTSELVILLVRVEAS